MFSTGLTERLKFNFEKAWGWIKARHTQDLSYDKNLYA